MLSKRTVTLLFFVSSLFLGSVSNLAVAQEEPLNNLHHESETNAKVQPNFSVVDLNVATLDELMSLKGIGKKRAEAILADRQLAGRFNRVEDLSRVKGMGEKMVARVIADNPGRIQVGK